MIFFGAVLPAEMRTVDSNDPQASPDSQHHLGIGYAPFELRLRSGLVLSALDTLNCSSSCFELLHVERNFSIWRL